MVTEIVENLQKKRKKNQFIANAFLLSEKKKNNNFIGFLSRIYRSYIFSFLVFEIEYEKNSEQY